MQDEESVPSRGWVSVTWVFFSALMAAVFPLMVSPFYLVYCGIQYDLLPIIGSEGWFLSHFFDSFGLYYKWSAISIGGIYILGQALILISPMAALKTAAAISATLDALEPPPDSRGQVWVRGHWRRRPRR